MKTLLLALLHAALATGGYLAGARLLGNTASSDDPDLAREEATHELPEDGNTDDGRLRDPRTGNTFAESREKLEDFADTENSRWGTSTYIEGKRSESERLEIHRIFALATQEEMIAFFAEEDLAKLNAQVLTAAYARLATLAPEEAAAIWSDRFEREGKSAGVEGLVHAWTLLDPDAAKTWVDNLPESNPVRDKALFALLDGALDSAPALARSRFTELESDLDATNIVTRIARTLTPEDFPAFAEQILSMTHGNGNWQNHNQLAAALEVWARQDGEAMLAWLGKQPAAKLNEHIIPRLTRALLKHGDPATIANELAPALDGNKAFAQLAGQAWLAWLASGEDDEGALAWLQNNGKNAEFPGMWSGGSQNWSAERADQILPQLSAIPDDSTRNALAKAILGGLSRSDPRTAIEWAQELLPEDNDTANLISNSVGRLARRENPETVLEWTLENLSPGDARNYSVNFLMGIWAASNPRAAADRVASLPDDLRDRAYSGIASRWAESNPEQVFDYLGSADDPSEVQALAKYALSNIGYLHGSRAHLDQALALPDAEMRAEAVPAFIDGWARANLEDSAAALNQLEKGPVRDASIEQFVGTAARSDRESALTWSLAIDSPGKRRQVTMRQARQWLRADKEKAKRWIESADALPEEWKGQLLGQE